MPKYLSANQRTILEMLADELGDKTAKRMMNVGATRTSPDQSKPATPSAPADPHKNEGFLKSAWHKLTHQHDESAGGSPQSSPEHEKKGEAEEPKKAAGSGSG
ncbi:MAG: hypothetical protein L6R42_011281 [Xanthoria sp. 1 TBL-2021]|nr:MAG: hypothetical protein L6R42_011281 [Xanthoria sp. 1 TBL-2021]